MKTVTVSLDMDVPASIIWLIWSDLKNSPNWDKDVKICQINGEFTEGTTGVCELKNGLKMKITLDQVIFEKSWSNTAEIFGLTLKFHHWLDITSSRSCQVTHQCYESSVNIWPLRRILQTMLKKSLTDSLENMKNLANKKWQPYS